MIQCKGKNNVCSNFSGVKNAVESSKLNRVMSLKKAVEVQEMISAVMVMCVSVVVISFVPNIRNLRHCARFSGVEFSYEPLIKSLTIIDSALLDLKCFLQKVVFGCDNIYKVSD